MPHTESPSPPPNSQFSGRLAPLSAEDDPKLFVYGSLQFPEVLEALIGRVPAMTAAVAPGWLASSLHGLPYPGLVHDGGAADGYLLHGLAVDEWGVLDAFENPMYLLERIQTSDAISGWTYACPSDSETPTRRSWNSITFSTKELAAYVTMCSEWRAKLGSS